MGRRLVESLAEEARVYELDAVFAFTYVVEFFQKVGFQVVERGTLPLKAWKDCVRCPKFQECDEVAVLKVLRWDNVTGSQATWGQEVVSPDEQLIQIPIPRRL